MKKKRFLGIASGGLAAILMAVTLFNNMNTVVHAKEVFTDVKAIRSEAEAEPFDVLEIVDKKSVFTQDDEGNLQLIVGEERFAYFAGGQEPFRELLNQLAEESRKFYYGEEQNSWQTTTDFESDAYTAAIVAWQQKYSQIVEVLAGNGLISAEGNHTVDPENYSADADYPLSRMKKETYLPANFDFTGSVFYIEKEPVTGDTDPEAEGYFAPAKDRPGCYEWDEANQQFTYVGSFGQYSTAMIDILVKDEIPKNETSVSDNDMISDNDTVSDNDTLPKDDTLSDKKTEEETTEEETTEEETTEEETTEEETTEEETTEEETTEIDTIDEEESSESEPEKTKSMAVDDQAASSFGNGMWKIERGEIRLPYVGVGNDIGNCYYNYYASMDDIPDDIKNDPQLKGMIVEINDTASTGGISSKRITSAEVYKTTYLGIQNNEWLKEQVFGVGLDGTREGYDAVCKIKVNVEVTLPDSDDDITTSDGDINALIDSADLLYLNADRNPEDVTLNPLGTDMNPETAMRIATRVTSQDKSLLLPCIVNANTYTICNSMKTDLVNPALEQPVNEALYNSNLNKLMHLFYAENIYMNYSDTEFNSEKWNEPMYSAGEKWQFILEKNEVWKDLISITVGDNTSTDNSFVSENVFFMKMDTVIPLSTSIVNYGEDVVGAYEDVYMCIEQENYAREQEAALDSSAQIETVAKEITYGTSIQTILVYTPEPAVVLKSSLRVLELQPCYDFTYARVRTDNDTAANAKITQFKKDFLPEGEDSNVKVEIIGMTTAEFCGKIEDINVEYDMIYIGTNTKWMHRVTNLDHDSLKGNSVTTSTIYNDTAMNGVVYAHTGDLFQIASDTQGLLQGGEPNNRYGRYSGNDILRNQKDKLLEFLTCGAPIILEEDLFFWDGNNITISTGNTTEKVNNVTRKGTLDSSSYLYQFIKTAFNSNEKKYDSLLIRGTKNNAVTIYEINKGTQRTAVTSGPTELSKWLNQPKLAIQMMSQPVEYSYSTENVNVSGTTVGCIADCNYLIPDEKGNYYLTYEFIIRNLASQKPASTTYSVELFIDANLDGKFSKTKEKMAGDELKVTRLSDGKLIDYRQLKVGEGYQISRRLPPDYIGVVPWKLEVSDNGNESLRSNITGTSAVSEANSQEIRILQLHNNAAGRNLETLSKDNNSLWKVLLENVPNRKITIKAISAPDYFNGTKATNVNLDDYDMLILGFSDTYLSSTSAANFNQDRLNAVINYAKSGKCVLFSHDNTSWQNGSGRNGTLDMAIRDLTGLDRYGATVGRGRNGFSQNNKVNQGKDIEATSAENLRSTIFSGDLAGKDRDIAFELNSEQKVMTKEAQGLAYSGTSKFQVVSSNAYAKRYLNFGSGINVLNTWNTSNTCRITKVNEGAITSYPYDLPDAINTQPTHGQYCQLDLESDMDGDNETDIVVWYCISDSVGYNNLSTHNDIYDVSPNDVRNNYYIYNQGNITYTGMGHSAINNEHEIKLFINIMMAAYQVSLKAPDISIVEGIGDNTEKTYDAIPYDRNLYGTDTMEYKDKNETYKVYFYVEDNNFVPSDMKTIEYQLLKGSQSGEMIEVDGEQVTVQNMTSNADWKVYDSDGTECKKGDRLYSGRYYYVEFPLQGNLSETASLDIYIRAQSYIDYEGNGKATPSPASTDTIRLHQIKLFDLD